MLALYFLFTCNCFFKNPLLNQWDGTLCKMVIKTGTGLRATSS